MKDVKVCECGCGLEFERPEQQPKSRWDRRRFLSEAHRTRARVRRPGVEYKFCAHCDRRFYRPDGQQERDWNRQKYCCPAHQMKAANGRQEARRKENVKVRRQKRKERARQRKADKLSQANALQAYLCQSHRWASLAYDLSGGFTHDLG